MRTLALAVGLATLTWSAAALASPLALAEPLQSYELTAEHAPEPISLPTAGALSRESEPQGTSPVEALTIKGSRGDGLNAAAQIYQAFSTLGLSPEVHCQIQPAAEARPTALYRSTIKLSFQGQLSPEQQQDVQQTLAALAHRTPAIELLP